MKVSIIMGSYSDEAIAFDVIGALKMLEIPYDVVVYSAHRTPNEVVDYVKKQEKEGTEVFISIAGKAAHLGGVIAAHTTRPVIGVPGKTSVGGGVDSLLSTVPQLPLTEERTPVFWRHKFFPSAIRPLRNDSSLTKNNCKMKWRK